MAVRTMVTEDLHSPQGSPSRIFLMPTDPWLPFSTKTWAIATHNNWAGMGAGELRIVGWDSRTAELRDAPWQNVATRVQLRMK